MFISFPSGSWIVSRYESVTPHLPRIHVALSADDVPPFLMVGDDDCGLSGCEWGLRAGDRFSETIVGLFLGYKVGLGWTSYFVLAVVIYLSVQGV